MPPPPLGMTLEQLRQTICDNTFTIQDRLFLEALYRMQEAWLAQLAARQADAPPRPASRFHAPPR